nr:H384 [uncultured bacterium]
MTALVYFFTAASNWPKLFAARTVYVCWALFAWSALTAHAWGETVVANPSASQPVQDSYFGMHVRWGGITSSWPSVRFHGWRVITGETAWFGLQPQKNKWQFSALDKAVALAERKDIEVMLTLGQTPQWAAARPKEKVPNGWGASSEPRSMSDWDHYVRTVVRRYKGRIKYYELWNEPRFLEVDPKRAVAGFTGTAKQMMEMGTIAKRALQDLDPDAKLVSPAVDARMLGLKRLEAWLDAGGGSVSDVIAYHIYSTTPEEIPEVVGAIRGILRKYGLEHRELWNTESGFLIESPDTPVKPLGDAVFAHVLTQTRGAAYMARSLILGAASGLNRFYWYAWDIPDMAMSTGKGRHITIVGTAYSNASRWLRGATIKECRTQNDQLWICTLNRGTRQARLVWNTAGPLDWVVPAEWQAQQLETLLGSAKAVPSLTRLQVDESPVLIVSDDQAWGLP